MTPSDPATPEDARVRETAARQRFFALGLFRLSGVVLVMFGFLIMMQRFAWVQGADAKMMGAIIACVGLGQAIIIPRILVRAWRSPPQ
jgi:hypothetical protein